MRNLEVLSECAGMGVRERGPTLEGQEDILQMKQKQKEFLRKCGPAAK